MLTLLSRSTAAQIRSLRDEMLAADDELAQRIAALEQLVKTLTASREASGKATKTVRTLSTSVSPLAADDLVSTPNNGDSSVA